MFTFLVILIVLGVIVVVALRATSAGRSARRSPGEQPTVVRPDAHAADADRPTTRPAGDPIPGSAEDRHRHGKP